MFSPIHHTFGPHINAAYLRKILRIACVPWKYRQGKSGEKLRQALAKKFDRDVSLFASGREALLAYFKAIHLQNGEEVIVQGYTCVVVPNAIHAAGGVPIYADISEETLNLTTETVRECITERTRVIICQHTFGLPSATKALRTLCDEKKILLIEDCAHVLPDTNAETIGREGDAVLVSFGRDKAISGIAGGGILVRNQAVHTRLQELESRAVDLSRREIIAIVGYGPRMQMILRPLIGYGLHKPILAILNRIGLFAPILTEQEREGYMAPVLRKIPNACAYLALHSLAQLSTTNQHRRQLTAFYLQHGKANKWPMIAGISSHFALQKFPLFLQNADEKRAILKAQNIHLDDGWTGCVVCPTTINIHASAYEEGTDKVAERVCTQIFSLPTHPTTTQAQAERLASILDDLLKQDRK